MTKYRCTVCNYVYDEETESMKFIDQPHDWTCPICGAPKTAFVVEGGATVDDSIETTDKMTASTKRVD